MKFYLKKSILRAQSYTRKVSAAYIMEISSEHHLLKWGDILLEDIQPMSLKVNLVHVNVARWNCFISAFESLILKNMNYLLIINMI